MSNVCPWIVRLLAGASLASAAFAGDYYVDAVNGSNANSGTSPAQAWRTVTHSLTQLPVGEAHVLHMASGVYDMQSGEVFPLQMRPRIVLSGAQASSRPVLSALGVNAAAVVNFYAAAWDFEADSGLEHLDVRGGIAGVRMFTFGGELSPRLHDVSIERFSHQGVYLLAGSIPGVCAPRFSRLRVSRGAALSACLEVESIALAPMPPRPDIVLRDCELSDSRGAGVLLQGRARLRLERCRVERNELRGLWLRGSSAYSELEIVDSLVADNVGEGLKLEQVSVSPRVSVELKRSTLAGNGAFGIAEQLFGAPGTPHTRLSIAGCVLANSAGDVRMQDPAALVVVSDSLVRDGQFDGSNGNLSLDPQFRAPDLGDYRLRLGSPCIDRVAASEKLDLRGRMRAIDGDLDTVVGGDLGAYEYETLELSSSGGLGDVLRLDVAGAAGAIVDVHWARTGLVAGQPTLFGEFELDPLSARLFTTLSAPGQVSRVIPNQPLLVGHTLSFQAVIDSAAAPLGRALSNGVELTVLP